MSAEDPHDLPYDEKIAELEGTLEAARQSLTVLEDELDWWRRGRALYGQTQRKGAANGGPARGARKPTLAGGIVAIMRGVAEDGAMHEWTAPAVMDFLRDLGWMPTGRNAEHTVRTKLGQLAKEDGPLVRIRHGVYVLAPESQDDDAFAVNGAA